METVLESPFNVLFTSICVPTVGGIKFCGELQARDLFESAGIYYDDNKLVEPAF